MLNDITKFILEICKGSLKINSSIIGNNNETFNILIGVRIISFRDGYKLKYLSGATKSSPVIMSIIRRIRNDFHTNFKKEEMDIISNCFPGLGFFRNIIKSLKSTIFQMRIN